MRRIAEQQGKHLSKQGLSTGAVRLVPTDSFSTSVIFCFTTTNALLLNPEYTVSAVQPSSGSGRVNFVFLSTDLGPDLMSKFLFLYTDLNPDSRLFMKRKKKTVQLAKNSFLTKCAF